MAPQELPASHLRWSLVGPEDDPPHIPLMQIHKWPYSKTTANTWRIMLCFSVSDMSEASRLYLVQCWFLGRSLDQLNFLAVLYPKPGPVEGALAHLLPGPLVLEPCPCWVCREAEEGRRLADWAGEGFGGEQRAARAREPLRPPPPPRRRPWIGVCTRHSWLPVFSSHV